MGSPRSRNWKGRRPWAWPWPWATQIQNLQPKIQEYEFTDDPIDVPRIPKNDAPNRFWARNIDGPGIWALEAVERPGAEAGGAGGRGHFRLCFPCRFWVRAILC